MTTRYDYLVLGAGSGGIASAVRAASYGARVGIIESGRLGGTCVNVGCVPKKVMWYAAHLSHQLHDSADYGFTITKEGFNWAHLKAQRDAYVERLNAIYANRLQSEKIDLLHGNGRFVDERVVEVEGQRYHGEQVLIATGGAPSVPNVPGSEYGITSDGFFELARQPQRIAVVGAGYIAVELAGVFAALGTETHLIYRREWPLRGFDQMLREAVAESLSASGVQLHSSRVPRNVSRRNNGGEQFVLELDSGERIESLDQVLWATGRRPLSAELGLERAGVRCNTDGTVDVDAYQATSAAGVYAVGDVTGQAELTPVAIAAGRRLSDRLFGGQNERKLDYDLIPTVMFSHPPLGTVGLTEEQARERHGDAVRVYKASFTPMFYAFTERKSRASVKLITIGDEERIVGCHVIGDGADEMLQGFAVAIRMGALKRDFDDTIAIHPTTAEELVTLR